MNHSRLAGAVSSHAQLPSDQTTRLKEILEHYLVQMEKGAKPDRDRVLAEHPELAEALARSMDKLETLHRATIALGDRSGQATDHFAALLPESRELGDYRIIRQIGRGGMGVVYEAEQLSLHRRVALKVLPLAAVLDERTLKRFKNEAIAAASLDHPHVVSVYSVGCERGVHFYAMELILGQSLAEVIDGLRRSCQQPPVSAQASVDTLPSATLSTQRSSDSREYCRSVAKLVIQAAEALEYAHEEGVVHRDIKPSNLLLDHRGKLWVSDFGLAQIQGDHNLTMTGDLVGTLRYMSPEQAEGSKLLDHRTDVYSLGAMLYELLTLTAPFDSDNRQQLLHQVADEQPILPRKRDASIPKDLETIVLKAMAKTPDSRYESAKALGDDLSRQLEHKPIRARRASRSEKVWRLARRNPIAASLVFAVVSLSIFLAIAGPLAALRYVRIGEQLARHLYMADMNRVQAAYEDGNINLVIRLLGKYEDKQDLRQFEWWYWSHMARRHRKLLLQIGWGAGAFAVKPDDKEVICVRSSEEIHRSEFFRRDYHQTEPAFECDARIKTVKFLQDGKILIGTGGDGWIHRWETNGWKRLEPLELPGTEQLKSAPLLICRLLATAPYKNNAELVAVGTSDDRVILCRADSWKVIGTFPTRGQIHAIAVAPNGSKLAVATGGQGTEALLGAESEGAILFWDIASQKEIDCRQPHRYAVLDVAFSPDGKWLATGGADRRVVLWDALTLTPVRIFDLSGAVNSVAFSSDSRFLAAGTVGENSVHLWDIESHMLMAVARGHNRGVYGISFPKDTGEMLSGAVDGRLIAWDLNGLLEGDVVRGRFYGASYTSDGRQILAAADDGEIWTIDSQTGQRDGSWNEGAKHQAVAFSEDGGVVAAIDFDGRLRTWTSDDHRLLHQMPIGNLTELGTPIKPGEEFRYGVEGSFPAAVSCDGTMFALPAREADVHGIALFNVEKGRRRFLKGGKRPAHAIAFSPSGDRLIGVLNGWHLWALDPGLWDLDSDSPIPKKLPHGGEPPGGAFSWNADDPLMAVAYYPNGISLVDPRTLTEIHPLLGHSGRIWCLAFSPDKQTIVSGATDSTLRLWDVATGKLRSTLNGHIGPVQDVAFACDGHSIVSCGTDRTLRIWRAPKD